MRRLVLLASFLLLAGCTDGDWTQVMTGIGVGSDKPLAYPAADAPNAAAAANYSAYLNSAGSVLTPEQKCARVAKERTDDVQNQGFDETVQRSVYDSAYADCMLWSKRAPQ